MLCKRRILTPNKRKTSFTFHFTFDTKACHYHCHCHCHYYYYYHVFLFYSPSILLPHPTFPNFVFTVFFLSTIVTEYQPTATTISKVGFSLSCWLSSCFCLLLLQNQFQLRLGFLKQYP